VYVGVPFADYCAIDACSQTAMNTIRTLTPAHWFAKMNGGLDDATDAKRLGTSTHAAVLEQADFEARYLHGPGGDQRKKEFKDAWEALVKANPDRICVCDEDWNDILAMRTAVWSHRSAREFLSRRISNEVTCVWERDGFLCKMRVDVVTDIAIGDLKTTRCASRRAFTRSIGQYGYHVQGAWYLEGAETLGLPSEAFAIIAVESKAPYATAMYTLSEESIEHGWTECERLFEVWKECRRTGLWPAYGDGIEDIGLSEWDKPQLEEVTE